MKFIISLIFMRMAIVHMKTIDEEIILDDMIFYINSTNTSRNAYTYVHKWDKGVIPYSFDDASGFTTDEKNTIIESMRKIEGQTSMCLSFKERTTEANWVEFKDTPTGCNSYVGKVGSGAQRVSLQKPGCIYHEVIIHELLHAAGYGHEQSRPDRDEFIEVIFENIQPGFEYAFEKNIASDVDLFNIPYDYYSIMHYRSNAFSVNGSFTILPLDPTVDVNLMGQRKNLSESDIKMIKLFYKCCSDGKICSSSIRKKFEIKWIFLIYILNYFTK